MSVINFLERLEAENQTRFRAGHRRPGLRFLQQCPRPEVQPYQEEIKNGVRSRIDVCNTCGRSHTTLDGVLKLL